MCFMTQFLSTMVTWLQGFIQPWLKEMIHVWTHLILKLVLIKSCCLANNNNNIPLTAFPGQCESAVVDNARCSRALSNQLHDVWHTRWSAYSILEGTEIYPCCSHLWNRWSCQRKFKVSVLLFHRVNTCAVFPLLLYEPIIYTLENLVQSVCRNLLSWCSL